MPLILNIDTAMGTASFCVAKGEEVLLYAENKTQQDHASWLHTAIKDAFSKMQLAISDLDAVAVNNGPGSYTGLRIGLSTAKGLCYALGKPLICLNNLYVMAAAVADEAQDLICPAIDARRMEIFTALYDKKLNIVMSPTALIMDKDRFPEHIAERQITVTGDGAFKLKNTFMDNKAVYVEKTIHSIHMVHLSNIYFMAGNFSSLAYEEPFYIKAPHITIPK
jgi:tRNA threonylcarbamoyladenosine biosynthesis protein TsaB